MILPRATHRARALSGHPGFSLIELLFVVFILATTAGIAIPVSRGFITSGKADSATLLALSALQEARERAINERRNIQVNFVAPNRICILRIEPAGAAATPDSCADGAGVTFLTRVELEGLQTFRLVTGVPDTPDKFGKTTATHFTGKLPVMFTSDGSLIDLDGDVVNGSIFLAGTGAGDSVRAVTIFGVTGLMRTWKWTGTQWQE
jgi:prepilin-type N-terminal cleavage/methylation domain-containing protein